MKKIIFSISISFLIVTMVSAQEIEWQNTIGGNSSDYLESIQQTADGGYILGARSWSDFSGDKTADCFGYFDYWIVKTDSLGILQWQNTIGGGEHDVLTSIDQTFDGGFILGGNSKSNISGNKTENTNGGEDYWIVKTDANGNIQWQNTIGGNAPDYLQSIQQTTDSGYILAGSSYSGITGDKTESNVDLTYTSSDYWIIKTDALGNIQWQNTIGGTMSDMLYSIQQTSDGGYILGGCSESNASGDKTENSNGGFDFWIVKVDATGNIQWQNSIGGSDEDKLFSMSQTNDGGYILGGESWSSSSGDKTENSKGMNDFWIVKTDATGNIQWQNTVGGSNYDQLETIQQTVDNGYILAGYSESNISGDKTESGLGSVDYWIVMMDSSGNIQKQNTIGGNEMDWPQTVIQTYDGGYMVGGHSESDISGDKTENNHVGSADIWLVKLTEKDNSITGKLFIDANSNAVQDISEPSIDGKLVTEINTGRFFISNLNGSYRVVVVDTGSFTVQPSQVNYYNPVPATHGANFSGIHLTDSLNDFAFQPAGVFNDLCVNITPVGAFRAGFQALYLISYENFGTTTLSPTVTFYPHPLLTFVSAIPAATSAAPDSVVWNFGPLLPFQNGTILVTVLVQVGLPFGTVISSLVKIDPVIGDANPSCNISSWEVLSTGSLDPNDILVDQDTLVTTQLPNPPYLEYTIRFQNIGNDTAFNVKVLNPVDTSSLQLSTLEIVSSSHPVNVSWIPWENNLEFRFNNILLPDSNVNEPSSHGLVRYRLKPKTTLAAGDSITNFAAIYFDFNTPVLTNNAITQIVLPTSVDQLTSVSGQLTIYPNPASNELRVMGHQLFNTEERPVLKIFDLFGRKVMIKDYPADSNSQSLDISHLSKGVYVVELTSGFQSYRSRFLKQ